MTGIQRISTKDMSREMWLEQRRKTIGGSDAAGIVRLSKWASPFSVWAEKTGRLPETEDNEAMRQGRDLEDYVAKRWTEQSGRRIHRVGAILYNPLYPFAHANVDRMVTGERAGLECKTTSALNIRQFHGADFPEQYYVQCVHYMAVTGAERWYLAVLVFGREFFSFTLERNQAEIDALMNAEASFWRLVQEDTPPPLDGMEASANALKSVYADSHAGTVDLFGRDSALREYVSLKQRKKRLDERMGEIENLIKGDMREMETGVCGLYRVSWKSQTRRTFQPKDFAKDHPGIDLSPYYKDTRLRPFKVTENGEAV
ncbi:MAG: YqaJ viral recombinase family protein [Oscillospiraceae bacterium]|nr:YqaJ viral recombinase family protein [Oscillospiraceae bacterium]